MDYLGQDFSLTSEYDDMSVDAILAEFRAQQREESAARAVSADSGKRSAQPKKTRGEHLSMPSKHRNKKEKQRRRPAPRPEEAAEALSYTGEQPSPRRAWYDTDPTGTDGLRYRKAAGLQEGYAFAGWYTKKSGGTKVTASTKFAKGTKLYAHWAKKKFKVTVAKGDGAKATTGSGDPVTVAGASAQGTAPEQYVSLQNTELVDINHMRH